MPAIRPGAKGAVISGWGTALPEKIITNEELAATMDTSDEWIRTRTGIEQRHVGGSTAGLSVESARQAIEMAGLDPSRIDALVLATTTPDKQWGTAAAVQNELGLSCGAFDVNAACSGFVYGLVTGHGLIAMGADRVLVIGTDTLSRITDWDDRGTAPLFADGSGAVVIESVDPTTAPPLTPTPGGLPWAAPGTCSSPPRSRRRCWWWASKRLLGRRWWPWPTAPRST